MSDLKKGYTTGVHASFAFKSALEVYLANRQNSICKTFKSNNDDLDVTKGCEIIVSISSTLDDLTLNTIFHKPYKIKSDNTTLNIYAGIGVGVVTKDGLKPPKDYAAINPTPLQAIKDIFLSYSASIDIKELYCTIGVTNGNEIAKQTANAKVGVLGGISILGTTGWVKPISASAYINSIEAELDFAKANGFKTIVFTLGNTAFKQTKDLDDSYYVIEIGNFIYDGINLAVEKDFEYIKLWLGIAKSVKIAQGFKNTHNRFGQIDFSIVQTWCKNKNISDCLTIKRVRELLGNDVEQFDNIIVEKTKDQLKSWFGKDIEVKIC